LGTTFHRRALIAHLGAGGLLAATARAFAAAPPPAVPGLAASDGSPIRNFALPSRAPFADVPGLQRFGAAEAEADVVVHEIFDYNCAFCRTAAPALDEVLAGDDRLALVLVHDPILSPASAAVAALQQTVFRRSGADAAHGFHRALLGSRGFVDAPRAKQVAAALGLDLDGPDDGHPARAETDLAAQRRRAADLGLKITPSFVVGDTAFIGWPGPVTLRAMVAAERSCGRLRCD